jgi:hypothetical protein
VASRPIFVSEPDNNNYIKEVDIDFKWYPGMSITQKQRSIDSLHKSAEQKGYSPILEISSKSKNQFGVLLSAFNLKLKITEDMITTVETTYQGSKIFEKGGPFTDLYKKKSKEAKKDNRLYNSGNLIGFELNGKRWKLQPLTAFYDWIYLNALYQNEDLANELIKYKAFTDIEYNPEKQYSCQARSAAYFVSLNKLSLLSYYLSSEENFLMLYQNKRMKEFSISIKSIENG